MGLSDEQNRLAALNFKKRASEISRIARERIKNVRLTKLAEGWGPNDPKLFALVADIYAAACSEQLWARATYLLEVADESGVALDDDVVRDMRSQIRKTLDDLIDRGRKAASGDPWGNFEGIIREVLLRTQSDISSEIERRHLEAKVIRPATGQKAAGDWVLTLHGIKTRGTWQKDLVSVLNEGGFNCHPLDYGYFFALQLVVPQLRKKKLLWFRDEYTHLVQRTGERPSIIAHSFGTYIVAGAIKLYSELKFDRVIFAGSIVDSSFEWSRYIPTQVSSVLNDCGGKDFWVWLAPWVIRDAGSSGRTGFSDGASGSVLNRSRPYFGHSEHFYDLNYLKSWVPFLSSGTCEDATPGTGIAQRRLNWRFLASLITFWALAGLVFWKLFRC